jgi:hypothetical protein
MLCTKIVLNVKTKNNLCTQHVLSFLCTELEKSMNNLLSYCGLVDPRISASDKDLPVTKSSNSHCSKMKMNGKELSRFHFPGVLGTLLMSK